jgi:RNA binding exosome subunit
MARPKTSFGFTSVMISFLIHSTEDVQSLVELVSRKLHLPGNAFEVCHMEGHYGNSLHYASSHITGDSADSVSVTIFSNLDEKSKKSLTLNLDSSLDEHDALYIRLDRQLLNQCLTLGSEEPIRIKFKPNNRRGGRKAVRDQYLDLLRP